MAWYWWVLLWCVLVLLALGLLGLLALSLWRRSALLMTEITGASDRLAVVGEQVQELTERRNDPAVFTSASDMRRKRFQDRRRRSAGQRVR